MARERKTRGRAGLVRAALMAVVILPWFYACPPSGPKLIPPQPVPGAEEPPAAPEADAPEEEVPLPEEKTGEPGPGVPEPADFESLHLLTVQSNTAWTDSGLEVEEGQRLFILADGVVSLQKGNPTAVCGPDGYGLKTVQQPLPDHNIGSLIGKVVLLLSVSTDPQTGKEVRDELVRIIPLGRVGEVTVPIRGRLYLGVNEMVVGDNEGVFSVKLYLLR
ncbi:MAG: hypothetical protein A2Y86_06380 [Candidatus Aminicenantes bacterium RBG_13_62_12]|nr:MAG: hypothetical protein A2Y86_06380 [Candidatus Aminicenantes bacterium RBG_13_62_12]